MKNIVVNDVKIDKNKINVDYSVGNELKKYFNLDEDFFVEYEEDMSSVPKAIAVIPFIVNVLPIIWLTDSVLEVNELDETFYNSIPKFKQGYADMYPDVEFKGSISVKNIVNCDYEKKDRCATFFSGGLDSYSTLINHLDEKPDLVALWGSDITFEDEIGWEKVKNKIFEVGEKYGLKPVFIKSSFRRFILEGNLSKDFEEILNDGWWHGVQHGIGLIGHIAPYAYKNKILTQYIASSYCNKDGKVTCASYPTIDNNIKFASCNIVHDQFEFNRQDKIKYVIDYCNKNQNKIELRVCWQSNGGGNCSKCEKCYRTIMGILVEGEDPNQYGFKVNKEVIKYLKIYITEYYDFNLSAIKIWKQIQKRAIEKKYILKDSYYYKDIKWIFNFDFDNYKKNFKRRKQKVKEMIYRYTKELLYRKYVEVREGLYIKEIITRSCIKENNPKSNIYVLLEPEHDNIGDHGIAWAQQKFICENFNSYNKFFITENQFNNYFTHVKKMINDEDIIFIHGGGNLGNQYMHHENSRRKLVESFPNNKIISFPQTMYFTNDDTGKKELENSMKIYKKHRDLTFIAREQTSFKNMKMHFKKNNVILTPDIVLYVNNTDPKLNRDGILICLRNDEETILNDKLKNRIINIAQKYFDNVKVTDMRAGKTILREERQEVLYKKFNEFKSSKLVITDRLHGMIFAAITGTPCIACSNYNHKVKETYEWIKYLDYIKFVENFDSIEEDIQGFKEICSSSYNNKSIKNYYNKIIDLL